MYVIRCVSCADGAGPSAVWMEFGEAVEEVILEDTAAGDTHATGQLLDSAAIKALLDIAHTSQTTSDSSKAYVPFDQHKLKNVFTVDPSFV